MSTPMPIVFALRPGRQCVHEITAVWAQVLSDTPTDTNVLTSILSPRFASVKGCAHSKKGEARYIGHVEVGLAQL